MNIVFIGRGKRRLGGRTVWRGKWTVIRMKKTEHFGWKDIYGLMGVDMDFTGTDQGPGEWEWVEEEAELPSPTKAKLNRAIHSQEAPVEVEG